MLIPCIKKSWTSHIISNFRSYTNLPCTELGKAVLNHAKCNRLQQAHAMVRKQKSLQTTVYYNYILKSCAKQFVRPKNLERSLLVLEDMKSKGVKPDSQNYIQLIIGLGLKPGLLSPLETDLLQSWLEEFIRIESKSRFPKKMFGKYKKVMQCLYTKRLPKHKENFFAVLDAYKNFELRDKETWNLVLGSCIRSSKMKDAEEVFERARQMKLCNTTTFHIMIKGYLQRKDTLSAHMMFKKMLTDNISADRSIYETFIQYYLTQTGKQTPKTLKRLWQGILLTTKKKHPIDLHIITSLTHYYRHNDALPEAEQLFLDLKLRKQPLETEYLEELNRVIVQFADKKQYLSAVSIYYDLIGLGHMPHSDILQHIVSALKKDNYFEKIDQVMKAMLESGEDLEVMEQLLRVIPSIKVNY